MLSRAVQRRGDRGAAAVEFALVVPFLVLLLLGIISYGMMLSLRQSISQAATEGARAAAVEIDPLLKRTAGFTAVDDALDAFGVTCVDGVLKRSTKTVGTCAVSTPGECTPSAGADVQCVTVTLTYQYGKNPLVPSFPGVGLVIPDELTYSAQARVS